MKHLITTCFCLVFTLSLYGQKQLALKEKIKIPVTQRKVTSSFLNKATGEFIRFFEQGSRNNPSGWIHGMIFPNGKESLFRNNEWLVSASENNLLILSPEGSENVEIKNYRIKDQSFSLVAQKTFSEEAHPTVLENGTIIISDESEGYGTQIEIYSETFKLLNTYRPFDKGFDRGIFSYSDGKIVFGFENQDDIKLAVFNAVTGKLLNEGILQLGTGLQVIHSFSDFILIYGSGTIVCLDMTGNMLWKNPYALPYLDIYHDKAQTLFLFSKNDLLSINARTGAINWRKNLKELNSGGQQPASAQIIRPVSFEADKNAINLILSSTSNGSLSDEDKKFNNYFVSMAKDGTVESRTFLSREAKSLMVKSSINGLQIIQDNEILRYEK